MLLPNRFLVETGQRQHFLRAREPLRPSHMAWVFEEPAREHAVRHAETGDLPGDVVVVRWWTSKGDPVEIDVPELRQRVLLAGEAKWSTQPTRVRALSSLRSRAAIADPTGLVREDATFTFWTGSRLASNIDGAGVLAFGPEHVTAR